MKTRVDARGMTCPQPVVLTARALATADQVTAIVDNPAAVENVTRLGRSRGFAVVVVPRADGTYLELTREGADASTPDPAEALELIACQPAAAGPVVILVTSDCLGQGPAELGERLMAAFFHTLLEVPPLPKTVVLMNTGAHLAVEGARCLEDLQALEARGVEILVCGTCLGYFNETNRLAAGRISNMYDIVAILLAAGKIVHV